MRDEPEITPEQYERERARKAAAIRDFVAEADHLREREAEHEKWKEYRAELRRQAIARRKRRVYLVNAKDEIVGDWPSRKEAAEAMGLSRNAVSKGICGGYWTQGGVRFVDAIDFKPAKKKPHVRAVRCLTDGREFPSIAAVIGIQETEKKYQLHHRRLSRAIRKRRLFRGKLYEFIPAAEVRPLSVVPGSSVASNASQRMGVGRAQSGVTGADSPQEKDRRRVQPVHSAA